MIGKRRVGHAGQSIVEILVAMVVLLIGIFGIIRLFPTGFGIIQYGQDVSQARKMVQGALEVARANAANLPDAVVPIDPGTGGMDTNYVPSTEDGDFTQPVPADMRFFGLNRTRRVLGEQTKIPSPTSGVLYQPNDP